jgi:hypothetical protein
MNLTPFVNWSQSQPETFHGDGLASDSVPVATITIYHLIIKTQVYLATKSDDFQSKLFLEHTP